MTDDPRPIADLTYEEALAELELVVNALETEELALDMAIGLYERGRNLTAHCTKLLDAAELRVKNLGSEES